MLEMIVKVIKFLSRMLPLLFIVLLAVLYCFFKIDLPWLKVIYTQMKTSCDEFPLLSALFFSLLYIVFTGLSVPGAMALTLLGGACFGLWKGTVLVAISSTLGATLALLLSRFLFSELVSRKWGSKLSSIQEGIKREGAYYLFTLRIVPLFPFFMVNLLMGPTPIGIRTYMGVTFFGILPATFLYTLAGVELSNLQSFKGIISPPILVLLISLGVLPLLIKKLLGLNQNKFQRPRQFDYDLIIIGGGAAGLVSASLGSTLRAKVALIEKDKMGGECLNTGCVPSKALIKISREMKKVDFAQVMKRVQEVIERIAPHDSVERFTQLGVDCFSGKAQVISPWHVRVKGILDGEKTFSARSLILAVGASPWVPPLPGLDKIPYLTSENLWQLQSLPARLLILGGGPFGLEMAQTFARFGSKVMVVEKALRILPREDEEGAAVISKVLEETWGVKIYTGCTPLGFKGKTLLLRELELEFDQVLIALGKRSAHGDLFSEEMAELSEEGRVLTNEYLQTSYPHIFACGDAVGPFQYTPAAAQQAWVSVINALLQPFWRVSKFKAEQVLPRCLYTDPEMASVGLSEQELQQQGIPYEKVYYPLKELDRAIIEGREGEGGFIKVFLIPKSDRLLGVTIVAEGASLMIQEFALAMKHRLGLKAIMQTIHPYPTMSEGNQQVALLWQKSRTPESLLKLLARIHIWRRGHFKTAK